MTYGIVLMWHDICISYHASAIPSRKTGALARSALAVWTGYSSVLKELH